MKLNSVQLTALIRGLESGCRPKGGVSNADFEVLSLGGEHLNDEGGFNFQNERFVSKSFYEAMRRGQVQRDDILIVKDGATTGKVSFVDNRVPIPSCINEHIFRVVVDTALALPKFVFYFLFSPIGNDQILRDFRGATVGGISQEFSEQVFVPLPRLPEQKRIVAILEKADRLRRARCYTRQLSDTFTKSVFLELFGDMATNPKRWDTELLGNLIVKGPQNGLYKPSSKYGGGTPILRIDGFYDGIVTDIRTLKRVRLTQPEIHLYELHKNEIVINRVNSPSHLGKSALIPSLTEPTVFESNMMRFAVDYQQIDPVYLIHFLQSSFIKKQIQICAKDAVNQSSINQEDVKAFKVRCPTRRAQQKFASIVLQFERFRAQQREAERQAEHLFRTLLHRAFAGELIGVAKSRSVKGRPSIPEQKRTYSPGVFYRRAAIEAYVINALCGDPYLGRTKLEKIDHLIEYHCGIDLERYPGRDAAGPDDYLSRMKLEHLANKRNWFSARDKKDGSIVRYLPKRGFATAANKGAQEIGQRREAVDNLLALMRPLDTKRCEIIATLYASWNDFLLSAKKPADSEIVHDVLHNWRPEKQLIPERRWLRGLKWMRDNGLVPSGQGKPVLKTK